MAVQCMCVHVCVFVLLSVCLSVCVCGTSCWGESLECKSLQCYTLTHTYTHLQTHIRTQHSTTHQHTQLVNAHKHSVYGFWSHSFNPPEATPPQLCGLFSIGGFVFDAKTQANHLARLWSSLLGFLVMLASKWGIPMIYFLNFPG